MQPSRLQFAKIEWRDNQPFSSQFDDGYYSFSLCDNEINGLAESQYVFLNGNRLKERISNHNNPRLIIAETGFGTGLNFLASAALWQKYRKPTQYLDFISIEKYPLKFNDMQKVLRLYAHKWPELKQACNALSYQYHNLVPFIQCFEFSEFNIRLHLIIDDVCAALKRYPFYADVWYLDGFAPAKNELMWRQDTLNQIAKHSHFNTTLATFTAAGSVRRGLHEQGFIIKKIPGYANKREMITATFGAATHNKHQTNSKAQHRVQFPWIQTLKNTSATDKTNCSYAVIGAGISGCTLANELAKYGQVDVWDPRFNNQSAIKSIGNCPPHAIAYSRIYASDNLLSQWNSLSYSQFVHKMRQLPGTIRDRVWNDCGLIQKYNTADAETRLKSLIQNNTLADIADITGDNDSMLFHSTGFINTAELAKFYLSANHIQTMNQLVTSVQQEQQGWIVGNASTSKYYDKVIIAASKNSENILSCITTSDDKTPYKKSNNNKDVLKAIMPLAQVKGQETTVRFTKPHHISHVICDKIYAIPINQYELSIGASFYRNFTDMNISSLMHDENISLAKSMLINYKLDWQNAQIIDEFAGVRYYTPDFLPYFGELVDAQTFCNIFYKPIKKDKKSFYNQDAIKDYRQCLLSNLYIMTGFGARAVTGSHIASTLLAQQMHQQSWLISDELHHALHPLRFLIKAISRDKIHLD